MSLDMAKLEKVRQFGGGIVQAQCPACKEGGGDKKGEHLRIYPDGRYGCCVHPKSREHRKRIFALAGGKVPSPGTFTVKVKAPRALIAVKSVKAALTQFTPGPPNGGKKSRAAENGGMEVGNDVQEASTSRITDFGTLGTGNSKSCAYAREDTVNTDIESVEKLKDLETAVPNVPSSLEPAAEVPPSVASGGQPERLPYLSPDGSLIIPFDSPERYHWWKPPHEGRLSPADTLKEVQARLSRSDAGRVVDDDGEQQ